MRKYTSETTRNISIKKLLCSLRNENIEFSDSDDQLNNVVFFTSTKKWKCSKYLFYRNGGVSTLIEMDKKNSMKFADMDDKVFYEEFLKYLILNTLQK